MGQNCGKCSSGLIPVDKRVLDLHALLVLSRSIPLGCGGRLQSADRFPLGSVRV